MKITASSGWMRILLRGGGILLAGAVVWGVFLLLWKPCLPFLLAWLAAALLQKPLCWLEQHLFNSKGGIKITPLPLRTKHNDIKSGLKKETAHKKRRRGLLAVLLVLAVAGIGITLPIAVGAALYDECGRFFAWIGDNLPLIADRVERMMSALRRFLDALPLPHGMVSEQIADTFTDAIYGMIPGMLGDAAAWFSARLSGMITAVIGALPGILLFLAVFLIAAVYMTTEYEMLRRGMLAHIPPRLSEKWTGILKTARNTMISMGRTYLLLGVITCGMLFAGLRLLGVEWALGAAVLGALIDLLPVLGVGTLLLPWALSAFLTGRAGFGTGLLVLYVVICAVRQILEPKLIGKTTGLHPLAALFAMYTGMKLFGIAGLFLLPFAFAVIRNGWQVREARIK